MAQLSNKSVIRTPRSKSKTAKAEAMFAAMPGQPRAVVIQRFEHELGLTPKGASTYYQTMRKRAGMVAPRGEGGTAAPKGGN